MSHKTSAIVPWRHGNLGILIVVKCRSYASSLKQAMHVIFVQKPISLRWSTTNSFISGVFETIAASNFGKSLSICALSSFLAYNFGPKSTHFRTKIDAFARKWTNLVKLKAFLWQKVYPMSYSPVKQSLVGLLFVWLPIVISV